MSMIGQRFILGIIIWLILPILLPVTIFIILRVWSNCFSRRFTYCRLVPLPLAMRWRREPLRMPGLVRSSGVLE